MRRSTQERNAAADAATNLAAGLAAPSAVSESNVLQSRTPEERYAYISDVLHTVVSTIQFRFYFPIVSIYSCLLALVLDRL